MSENKTALKITKLNKTLGRRHILHDVDLEAYQGEVFGFLGPNGAGKTTTIKIIVGERLKLRLLLPRRIVMLRCLLL